MRRLVLASSSPRRRELLASLGIPFTVMTLDTDETIPEGLDPAEGAVMVAERKAREAAANLGPEDIVLAADTIVVVDGEVLGKPKDADDARRMLRSLSGRAHEVITGVALRSGEDLRKTYVSTKVLFRTLDPEVIEWYLGTGEPFDKAGGYGIQGFASAFALSVTGSCTNVIGLPLAQTVALLEKEGFAPWQTGTK